MDDPEPYLNFVTLNIFHPFSYETLIYFLVLIVLIVFSALVSGSEVALFSLTPTEKDLINNSEAKTHERVRFLLIKPKKLLATILIANNFINIAIILLSTITIGNIFNLELIPDWANFLIQAIGITFIILLFGEVIPKVYATKHALNLACFMSTPLNILVKVFSPISFMLVSSTKVIDKRVKR
ncbi:MAG: DUF21 domain-containing protein, partial [Flavobacteriales bacterium]|nr:DUF21 domain-containing protein [Flavobacteriales bacterium]